MSEQVQPGEVVRLKISDGSVTFDEPTDEQLIAGCEGMWYGGEEPADEPPADGEQPDLQELVASVAPYVISLMASWLVNDLKRRHGGERPTMCGRHGIQPTTSDGLCGLCVQQRTAERCPCGGLYYADHWRGCEVCQNCGEDRA